MKAFFSWSGGKDSALALYQWKREGRPVDLLVATVNAATNRVSMHGVRRELLEAQAAAVGLPLRVIELPETPGMAAYEEAMRTAHRGLVAEGFTTAVFGDIFLEDLKAYREELLLEDGLACAFPLWQKNTRDLLQQFILEEHKAVVVCVNAALLDRRFCGRNLDEDFLNELPTGVDACGENGEYHSFVYDGPLFTRPVSFAKGDVVFAEYPSPRNDRECFAAPQPKAGFYFQDLIMTAP